MAKQRWIQGSTAYFFLDAVIPPRCVPYFLVTDWDAKCSTGKWMDSDSYTKKYYTAVKMNFCYLMES
jgi:hypothetical protein